MLKSLANFVLNLLSPQQCLGCGAGGMALCPQCALKTKIAEPVKLENIYSAGNYHDPVLKKAVWLLKYRGIKSLAESLAELMHVRLVRYLETESPRLGDSVSKLNNWVIVPIPLHKKRLKERGYNQSELLAQHLSDKLKIPVRADVLYKNRHTETQVTLKDRQKRLKNLIGAFSVKNPEQIDGKKIILVDDVTTTGATIREASGVLKNSGATRVIALTLARD